jgi:hypothetical protein
MKKTPILYERLLRNVNTFDDATIYIQMEMTIAYMVVPYRRSVICLIHMTTCRRLSRTFKSDDSTIRKDDCNDCNGRF